MNGIEYEGGSILLESEKNVGDVVSMTLVHAGGNLTISRTEIENDVDANGSFIAETKFLKGSEAFAFVTFGKRNDDQLTVIVTRSHGISQTYIFKFERDGVFIPKALSILKDIATYNPKYCKNI